MPSDLELLARVGVAALLGALLGFERERRGQVAGLRTHALVACGAAVFTIGGAYGFADIHRGANVDPMRVAAQVASGIGFIGAGAILREGTSVRGLTTAASLWAAAAIGLAAAAGMTILAAGSVAVVLIMLVGLRVLRDRVPSAGSGLRVVTLDYERGHGTLGPVLERLRAAGAQLQDVAIDDGNNGTNLRHVELTVRTSRPEAVDDAIGDMAGLAEVRDAGVQSTPR
jgi:putative Mg2+ transporter-C (MgtC) family protein